MRHSYLGLTSVALAMLASACGGPSQDATVAVPHPDLSSSSTVVRKQLEETRERTAEVIASTAATTAERAQALGSLGEHYHAYEFHQSAIQCYQSAQRLAPEAARWVYLEGVLQQTRGELEAAERALASARRLDRQAPEVALRLGEVLVDLERGDDAEPLLLKASREPGLAAAAHAALARLAVTRGDHEAAIEHFDRAVDLQPDANLIYASFARSLRSLGRDAEAAAAQAQAGTREALRSDPILAQVLAHRRGVGHLLAEAGRRAISGDLEGAERTYREAMSKAPGSIDVKRELSGVLLALGSFDEAENLLRELLERDAADTETRLRLARLLELRGDGQSALAEYRQAVATAGEEVAPRLALAAALHRSGDPLGAVDVYDAVLVTSPADRRAVLGRIQALADAQRMSEAWRALGLFVAEHPDDVDARLLLGRLQAGRGDLAAAEETFRSILDTRNIDVLTAARAAHGLGNLLAHQGRMEAAESAFRRAVELDPELDSARAALESVRSAR